MNSFIFKPIHFSDIGRKLQLQFSNTLLQSTSIIDTVILSFIDLQQLPRNSMQDNGNGNADVSLFEDL